MKEAKLEKKIGNNFNLLGGSRGKEKRGVKHRIEKRRETGFSGDWGVSKRKQKKKKESKGRRVHPRTKPPLNLANQRKRIPDQT